MGYSMQKMDKMRYEDMLAKHAKVPVFTIDSTKPVVKYF